MLAAAPHERAVIAGFLASRASAVEEIPADSTVLVITSIPAPHRHCLPARGAADNSNVLHVVAGSMHVMHSPPNHQSYLLTWTSMARGQEVLQLSQDSISVVILQANALHVHNYRKKFSKGEMTSSALNVSAFRPGCDPHLYLGYLSRKLAIAARHSICNDYVQGKTTNIPQEHLHLLKHEGTLMHFS
eukprot:scpid35884/ scgid4295/ 